MYVLLSITLSRIHNLLHPMIFPNLTSQAHTLDHYSAQATSTPQGQIIPRPTGPTNKPPLKHRRKPNQPTKLRTESHATRRRHAPTSHTSTTTMSDVTKTTTSKFFASPSHLVTGQDSLLSDSRLRSLCFALLCFAFFVCLFVVYRSQHVLYIVCREPTESYVSLLLRTYIKTVNVTRVI